MRQTRCPCAVLGDLLDRYRPPIWPARAGLQQIPLDLAVDDLDTAERQTVGSGATKKSHQPNDGRARVMRARPAVNGRPFDLRRTERPTAESAGRRSGQNQARSSSAGQSVTSRADPALISSASTTAAASGTPHCGHAATTVNDCETGDGDSKY